MGKTKATPALFKKGDWVSLQFGARRMWGQVTEDRGLLGVNGRRLYGVRLDVTSSDPIHTEVPEGDLERAIPDKQAVLQYLKTGGLLAILRGNLGGGPEQP